MFVSHFSSSHIDVSSCRLSQMLTKPRRPRFGPCTSPSASLSPLMDPTEVVQMISGRIPVSYRYCTAPTSKSPRAPPPLRTSATVIVISPLRVFDQAHRDYTLDARESSCILYL